MRERGKGRRASCGRMGPVVLVVPMLVGSEVLLKSLVSLNC